METKKVLQADYLDIIFDNRNKAYGGYELRKHYNSRAGKAAASFFIGLGVLISLSFIGKRQVQPDVHNSTVLVLTDIRPPVHPPIPRQVTPPPPPAPAAKTKEFTIPKIVIDKEAPVDKAPTEITEMANANPGLTTNDTAGTGIGSVTEAVSGTGTDTKVTTQVPKSPVLWVPQMPAFNGVLNDYIAKHLRYPDAARSSGIEGTVLIRFVVNEDGSVSDVTILRSVGGGCDEEALRMVAGMPKWKPGRQNGTPVKVYFNLPIRFQLD